MIFPYEFRFERWNGYADINSIPYRHLRHSDYPEVYRAIAYVSDVLGLSSPKDMDYINRVVCNLYLAHLNNKCVGIPRRHSYWDAYNKANRIKVSRVFLIRILNLLKEYGIVGEKLGEKKTGLCTVYWAKPELYDRFKGIMIHMIHEEFPPFIIMRDKDGYDVYKPRYTPEIKSLRDFLTKYCEFLNTSYVFSYIAQTTQYSDINGIIHSKQVWEWKRTIPTLSAIYARSNWACGGRLYSSAFKGFDSYQTLPSKTRKTIKINGETTCELDFKSLHITMLYHLKGINYSDDAYSYLSRESRPLAKSAAIITINAPTKASAILAIAHQLEVSQETSLDAVDRFIAYHTPIAEYICSDKGIELQNLDSKIMIQILRDCFKNNIPALPVHDSVICRISDKKAVEDSMRKAYKNVMNFDIQISKK